MYSNCIFFIFYSLLILAFHLWKEVLEVIQWCKVFVGLQFTWVCIIFSLPFFNCKQHCSFELHLTHLILDKKYMLFASWEVRMVKKAAIFCVRIREI